jgi:hypothetical protein
MVVKRWVSESKYRFRNIVARCFHGNVVVVGEVDTSMALVGVTGDAKQLTLGLNVLGTWYVLSITPLTVSRPTRRRSRGIPAAATIRTTACCRIAVGVWVKGSMRTLRWPAIAGGSVAARLEVWCASPFAASTIDGTIKKSVTVNPEHSQLARGK